MNQNPAAHVTQQDSNALLARVVDRLIRTNDNGGPADGIGRALERPGTADALAFSDLRILAVAAPRGGRPPRGAAAGRGASRPARAVA